MSIIEFHDKLIYKTKNLLENVNVNFKSDKKYITILMLHFLGKGYKLLRGINTLCKSNLETDAKILLRSLYEDFCLSKYIEDDLNDKEREMKIFIRGVIAENKKLSAINKKVKLEKIDKTSEHVKKLYGDCLKYFRNANEYSSLSDKKIVGKIEDETKLIRLTKKIDESLCKKPETEKDVYTNFYNFVARDCSASVHCNDFHSNVEIRNNACILFMENSQHYDLILKTSANLFIEIMSMTNAILKFEKDLLIDELEKEYNLIRNELPPRTKI